MEAWPDIQNIQPYQVPLLSQTRQLQPCTQCTLFSLDIDVRVIPVALHACVRPPSTNMVRLDGLTTASSPGDQHQAWANPFEETKPRMAEWTAKEIATIASRLDKQLGPEYISSRAGPGGARVHYLTAEKVIGLANEVFGFNGWSSSIQNIQVDFADENPQSQRVSIGLSVIVRVTLRDGSYHEDVGYGSIENAKGKAMAFEKAKKEGTTDALKRTLRNFGNMLGNCIYDQDYVKQVTKIKAQTNKRFDPDNLHRHSEFVKKEPTKDMATNSNMGTAGNNTAANAATAVATATAPTSAAGGFKLEPMDSFDDFLGGMLSSDGFEEIEAEYL